MTHHQPAEIVPFGKYKGQPVEVLAADTDYCEWLTAQPWFKARYTSVYNTIINYGPEPQESPEHNQMQARFLDDGLCFRLADMLYPGIKYDALTVLALLQGDAQYRRLSARTDIKEFPPQIDQRRFEDRGWDVTFTIQPASIDVRAKPDIPADDLTDWSDRDWIRRRCRTPYVVMPAIDVKVCAELKPDLGDDYPAVLRQVLRYPTTYPDRRCVIARRAQFAQVTWDQVVRIFEASGITLMPESALELP
jgi:hypothetical protein